ncbi:SPFH domain-containing protein [Streptomyces fradiae]|uniref:SPFH domain-containing protein n=1 Tax=Streptomyces fradiae TaxID=1906 RepID=UPI003987D92C
MEASPTAATAAEPPRSDPGTALAPAPEAGPERRPTPVQAAAPEARQQAAAVPATAGAALTAPGQVDSPGLPSVDGAAPAPDPTGTAAPRPTHQTAIPEPGPLGPLSPLGPVNQDGPTDTAGPRYEAPSGTHTAPPATGPEAGAQRSDAPASPEAAGPETVLAEDAAPDRSPAPGHRAPDRNPAPGGPTGQTGEERGERPRPAGTASAPARPAAVQAVTARDTAPLRTVLSSPAVTPNPPRTAEVATAPHSTGTPHTFSPSQTAPTPTPTPTPTSTPQAAFQGHRSAAPRLLSRTADAAPLARGAGGGGAGRGRRGRHAGERRGAARAEGGPVERDALALPGWVGLAAGALALAACGLVAWWSGALPEGVGRLLGLPFHVYEGPTAGPAVLLALSVLLVLFAFGGLVRGQVGYASVLTLFGDYRGTVRRTGLLWVSPLLLRRRLDVRLRHWRSEPLPAVDAKGTALRVVVLVVWRVRDTLRAALAVDDHERYLREQVEAALARVLSRLPADVFHGGEPTLRDADAVGEAMTRMVAAECAPAGIEVFSVQPTGIEYAPEIASAMRRRRIAAIDAQHRDVVLGSVVDAVDDMVRRLTERGLVDLDDYERKDFVRDLSVAFYQGHALPVGASAERTG